MEDGKVKKIDWNKPQKSEKELNPYNIPVHNQGNKSNCSSHAVAIALEYQLSEQFKERTLIDVDDLWEKQKKFGTATEDYGDSLEGVCYIAKTYGVRFKTDSGKTGTLFLGGRIEFDETEQPTVENLVSQIKILHSELERLGVPIFPKKPNKWDSFVTTLKNFWQRVAKRTKQSKSLSKYLRYKKNISAAYESGKKILHGKETKEIKVCFNFLDTHRDVENILDELHDFKVEITDNDLISRKVSNITEQYAKKGGEPFAGGTGAVLPEGFVNIAFYVFSCIISPWLIGHILDDLDNLLWDKLKSSFLKIYRLIRKIGGKQDMIIVASYRPLDDKIPTITFSVSSELSDMEFEGALDKIPELLKSSMNIYEKDHKIIFEFKYDAGKHDWCL